MDTIISACISAGVTLLICLITQHAQSNRDRVLLEYKLDELTKRVDKHNNLIERMYCVEQKTEVQDVQIQTITKELDGMKRED